MIRNKASVLIQIAVIALAAASARAADPAELTEVLEAAMTVCGASLPLDVVCRTDTVDRFGEDVSRTEVTDFRLQIDLDRESIVFAGKSRTTTLAGASASNDSGNLQYWGFSIQKTEVRRLATGGLGNDVKTYSTFKDAIDHTLIPLPQFWCVLPFASTTDGARQLSLIVSQIIMNKQSKVALHDTFDGLRYSVRRDVSKKEFDIYSWEFELPNYLPLRLTVDRAANGAPVRYSDQTVLWGHIDNVPLPAVISLDTVIVRPTDGKLYQKGVRTADTEFGWISVGKSSVEQSIALQANDAKGIDSFLNSGRERILAW